ncbi:MAG: hypothetical protein EPO07_19120, partial [Verrucomicrobia bacterium]
AAVFQSGGTLTLNRPASVDNFKIGSGANSWGYYNLSGGSLTNVNEVGLGANASGTVGVMDISGGTFSANGWLTIGRGSGTSSGVLNVSGTGTVNLTGAIDNTRRFRLNWAGTAGAQSIVNVSGGGSIIGPTSGISLSTYTLDLSGANIAGTLGEVNLNSGGLIQIFGVTGGNANPTCLLNFNGGTLKATAANTAFLTDSTIDGVYLYSGGATIDDNGVAITVSRPLLAPTDSGVSAIAVTAGGSGYIGAPMVAITGGTGAGATAIANMADDGTGNGTYKVDSLTITSPGVYTVAPTTVTLTGGGATTAATIGAISATANASGGLTKTGLGTLTVSGASSYTGNVNINAGTLSANLGNNFLNPTTSALGNPQVARNINVNDGGTLTLTGPDTLGGANTTVAATLVINSNGVVNNAGNNFNTFGPVQLNGGTLTGTGGAIAGYQMYNLRGTVTVGGSYASTISGSGTFAGYHLASPTTFNVADVAVGTDLMVSGIFVDQDATDSGAGSLNKTGAGTMVLSGPNTYTGNTTINAGTLALSGSGTIASTPLIAVGSGATFDVSAVSFVLGAGQTLAGNGTVLGAVTVNGTVAPGASIGTLTLNSSPALSGTTLMEINTTNSPATSDLLVVNAALAYGGTLTVVNTGDALVGGEQFDLFDATSFSGAFSATNLPALGSGLNWWLGQLSSDGKIIVNRAPTASDKSYTRNAGSSLMILKSDLLVGASDVDSGDSVSFDALTSAGSQGATVSENATAFLYEPANNNNDLLTFRVKDARGGTVVKNITITVNSSGSGGTAQTITPTSNGMEVSFAGIPGFKYDVERAEDVSFTVNLTTLATTNAPGNGLFSITDATPPSPTAYYRLKYNPN